MTLSGQPTQVAPERVFFIPVTWKETRAELARSGAALPSSLADPPGAVTAQPATASRLAANRREYRFMAQPRIRAEPWFKVALFGKKVTRDLDSEPWFTVEDVQKGDRPRCTTAPAPTHAANECRNSP